MKTSIWLIIATVVVMALSIHPTWLGLFALIVVVILQVLVYLVRGYESRRST